VSEPGPAPDPPHRVRLLARTGPAAAVAFVGGALFGLQTRVNGELAERSGSPVWAAVVSFGSGLAVLLVVVAAVPRLRRAAARGARNRLPWWTYLGGLAGGTLVVLSSQAVPLVGVATFTVGVVAGQAAGGLAVDQIGLGPAGPQPLSAWRVAGAAIAIVAVAILRLGHGHEAAVSGGVLLALLIAAAVGGAMASAQQALNGRVQRATGQGLLAATVNFSAGMALLLPVFAIAAGTGHGPDTPWPPALWLYAGGVLGIAYIASSIWTVGTLGVLRLGLLLVAGQLAGGVVIDLASPGRTGPPGAATYAAVALTLVAVLVAGRGQSRSRRVTRVSATATKSTR
jgi:bacterial/archaeal transporter family-2 protein